MGSYLLGIGASIGAIMGAVTLGVATVHLAQAWIEAYGVLVVTGAAVLGTLVLTWIGGTALFVALND